MPEKKLATAGAYEWLRRHQRRMAEQEKNRKKLEKRIRKLSRGRSRKK